MTHTASHHGELTMQTHNLRACKDWAALATMALCSCFGADRRRHRGLPADLPREERSEEGMLHRIHNGLPVKRRGGPFGSPGHQEILF